MKARSGKLKNVTGIDSPYERPKNPELCIDAVSISIDQSAEEILRFIKNHKLF